MDLAPRFTPVQRSYAGSTCTDFAGNLLCGDSSLSQASLVITVCGLEWTCLAPLLFLLLNAHYVVQTLFGELLEMLVWSGFVALALVLWLLLVSFVGVCLNLCPNWRKRRLLLVAKTFAAPNFYRDLFVHWYVLIGFFCVCTC